MKRKMLFCERLMYVDGKTSVNCVIAAKIRGYIDAENLQTALEKVQAKHPLLHANVVEEDGLPYFAFSANPPKVPVRIVERYGDDDWQKVTAEEWKIPFNMSRDPLIRFVWIKSEDVSELLLIGHHCACDGGSLIAIFREILQLTDRPDMPLTPYPPFESLRDLLPEEVFSDTKTRLKAKVKATLFRLFAYTVKTAKTRPKSEHYLIYWRGSPEESAALTNRCKEEGTTPYAALCVAFMLAFQQVSGAKFKNKLICPVNIRRFVKKIGDDMIFNYAPTIALALDKDSQEDFWSQAKKFKQSISEKVGRLNVYEELMGAEQLHASLPKLISLLLQSKGTYDFAFSNVGRLNIQENYQTFRIENFLGTTVAVPWRNATTLVTTHFRGQTDVAFVSNEGFLPYAEAIAIKEKAIGLLLDAVGTQVPMESGVAVY